MATAAEHYSNLLANVYLWMVGGIDAALVQGAADVAAFCDGPAPGRVAADLGAGFGMHAIPLAKIGYTVTAIDTSPELLSELRLHGAGLAIRTVEADLLDFDGHLESPADLIICMGDTLTHLQDQAQVEELFSKVARSVARGGMFVLTFRDYTNPPIGPARFIPVRSDSDRIMTCFLETSPSHVEVHDIVHERDGESWRMRVSSYKKVRLSPDWVAGALEARGFRVRKEQASRGMIRIVATAA